MSKVEKPQFLFLKFTDRRKLAKMFEEWCRINNVWNCPESFVAWMFIQDYLNIDKIMDDFKIMDEGERND